MDTKLRIGNLSSENLIHARVGEWVHLPPFSYKFHGEKGQAEFLGRNAGYDSAPQLEINPQRIRTSWNNKWACRPAIKKIGCLRRGLRTGDPIILPEKGKSPVRKVWIHSGSIASSMITCESNKSQPSCRSLDSHVHSPSFPF